MTQSSIDEHSAAMMAAFARVLGAEQSVRVAEAAKQEAETVHGIKVAEAQTALAGAWQEVESLMAETGEVEVILPGAATDYKIARSKPRASVKIASPDAVPDEFVKLERKPKLKEIGEHLKALADQGVTQPNWASFETGKGKLGWSPAKKVN